MKFIQFYELSTGYVSGSIPPQYSDDLRKPIERCGSDGVYVLDGRLGLARCILQADSEMQSPKHHRSVGYRIMKGSSFSDAKPIGPYRPRNPV